MLFLTMKKKKVEEEEEEEEEGIRNQLACVRRDCQEEL